MNSSSIKSTAVISLSVLFFAHPIYSDWLQENVDK